MVTVPLNITGGTAQLKSRALSNQLTRNFWPRRIDEPLAKDTYILEGFPGLKLFGSTTGNADRGMLTHLAIAYQVSGENLFSFDSAGVSTSLGTIPGAERCILEGIGSNVVIVTDGKAYQWDTAVVTEITDADLETPNSVAHLNNQMLFDGDGGRFVSSDVGDATSIDALNFATAESNADDLTRIYVHAQIAYMLGDVTTEPHWNSGVGKPPFDRIEQGLIPVGLGALHAVTNDDDFIYWLTEDLQVVAVQGSNLTNISDQSLVRAIQSYTTTSDAIMWTLNLEGTWLLMLTFPTAQRTWVYPRGGEWFEWSNGTVGSRSLANSYMKAHGKHLIGDYTSGNVYELDFDTFTDNGDPIIRTRDTAPIHGGLIGSPGKTIEVNRFELIMETGIGLLAGQGSDPIVMISMSDDDGATFGTEMWIQAGKLGKRQTIVELHGLGTFTSLVIRLKVSDPVYWSFHSAVVDIEVGI